ncbi:efflux RND transporter permease subunit [Rhodovibrionaceae bacterium A322]
MSKVQSRPQNKPQPLLVSWALTRPRGVIWSTAVVTFLALALALLPTLAPQSFPFLSGLTIDTDPENMLADDEPVRVFHRQMKKEFDQRDLVVVGLLNRRHPDGIFNPESLSRIHGLARFAQSLQWDDPAASQKADGTPSGPATLPELEAVQQKARGGVVAVDVLAPSTVDNIEQAGPGTVSFSWLMPKAPESREEALAVKAKAEALPLLADTLVSENGQALALYLPLTDKHWSYQVRDALLEHTQGWEAFGDEVHITGLPVAEDTFGVEMFIQMAISAPAAMVVIFLLLWFFFRQINLIIAPMLVAMAASLTTMGLLVATGNTVHIMSSMIPIFIMPIAVLDAVHILSEFFDRYQTTRDKRQTLKTVLAELYAPMLFTSLTTVAGFASLALTPIPPVQVFGVFVAVGVALAWFWTITFVPAFILFIPDEKLADFGMKVSGGAGEESSWLARNLPKLGRLAVGRYRLVLLATLALAVFAGVGMSRIVINDNPIRWFKEDHAIRVADRALNSHFAGSYMAYLALTPAEEQGLDLTAFQAAAKARGQALGEEGMTDAPLAFAALAKVAQNFAGDDRAAFYSDLAAYLEDRLDRADGEGYLAWEETLYFLDEQRQAGEIFKQPDVLDYLDSLKAALEQQPVVGKVSTLSDLVKTVHRELWEGDPSAFRVPDSAAAVAQTLLTFQNSHRPQDLWRFVTPDYRQASLWLQLRSGDNRDMKEVMQALEDFVTANPLPEGLSADWYGLTYINVVWQEKMVAGMAKAFLGSFAVVLVMMVFLFRSFWWGLLSMVPLTLSVAVIYGVTGIIGKDYDMPVAVLSALSLGLAVDYAIHFLSRTRAAYGRLGSAEAALQEVFGEPARAIARNAIVLGVGFLPLLFASLVPYNTVGILIASILLAAGLTTLVLLPALLIWMKPLLFKSASSASPSA